MAASRECLFVLADHPVSRVNGSAFIFVARGMRISNGMP